MSVKRTAVGYQYIDLATAKRLGHHDMVNVFGVVIERLATRKTRGIDMVSELKIIDPSLMDELGGPEKAALLPAAQLAAVAVDARFFAPDAASMPHPREGDIVRLHRVKVDTFHNRCQLIASLNPRYRFNIPAFCLFRGVVQPDAPDQYDPYQLSSSSYHFDEREAKLLDQLRDFVAKGAWRGTGELQANQYVRRLRDVIRDSERDGETMQFADIVGQVLAVELSGRESNGGGGGGENDGSGANGSGPVRVNPHVVWVWDASDAPPFPPLYSTPMGEVLRPADGSGPGDAPPPPPQLPPRRAFPVASLPPAVLARLPSLGTAVPIIFRAEHQELPEAGSWVKLRNCGFRVAHGQLQGLMTAKSRWAAAHPDKTVAEEYSKRVARAMVCQWAQTDGADDDADWASAVTAPGARDRPFTTLRRIAADMAAPGAEPATYRCLVRVLGHFPERGELERACVPAREAWEAAQAQGITNPRRFLFALRLTLEDGSGTTLEAGLFGTDAETFFADAGVRPDDLSSAAEARQRLQTVLDALTGRTGPGAAAFEASRKRKREEEGEHGGEQQQEGEGAVLYQQRWLEVCLATYVPAVGGGEGADSPAPRYRIFGTRLKPILG